jgi:hypothetical protein
MALLRSQACGPRATPEFQRQTSQIQTPEINPGVPSALARRWWVPRASREASWTAWMLTCGWKCARGGPSRWGPHRWEQGPGEELRAQPIVQVSSCFQFLCLARLPRCGGIASSPRVHPSMCCFSFPPQTKVIPNNENPVWNEEFEFVIDSPVRRRRLHERWRVRERQRAGFGAAACSSQGLSAVWTSAVRCCCPSKPC